MISYFPQLYPDELLYSACARYKRHVALKSHKDTVEILFKSRTQSATIDLPSNIKLLHEQFNLDFITTETLINNHTLFPFYSPFLTIERAAKVGQLMHENPKNQGIHGTVGLMSYGVSVPKSLRFCKECVKEDQLTYGEIYWHRNHQIPGVYFCYKHHQLLSDTAVSYTGWGRKHYFITLEQVIEENLYQEQILGVQNKHYLLRISLMAANLIKQSLPPIGLETIKNKYKSILSDIGYITPSSNIRFKQLIGDFTQYYSCELLEILYSDIGFKVDTWLHKVLRKPRVTCHPIRHLLLINFFKMDVCEFNTFENKRVNPFGDGPWICMNRVASHYEQHVVTKCEITYDNKTKNVIGTFKCSCGFTYQRKGPVNLDNDIIVINKVKCFGETWIAECKKLYKDSSLTLREKAKKLGVDPKTVHKYALSSRDTEKKQRGKSYEITEMEKRKKSLMATIETSANPTRTNIRKENTKDYVWLYRHNRNWLYSVVPLKNKKTNANKRVDWVFIDEYTREQVKKVISEILTNNSNPIRLTRAEISRRIEKPNLIEYSLEKLPKTKHLLQKFIETTDEFQIRRINWIVDNMDRENGLTCWRIKRQAGINKCSNFVNKYLQIITNL